VIEKETAQSKSSSVTPTRLPAVCRPGSNERTKRSATPPLRAGEDTWLRRIRVVARREVHKSREVRGARAHSHPRSFGLYLERKRHSVGQSRYGISNVGSTTAQNASFGLRSRSNSKGRFVRVTGQELSQVCASCTPQVVTSWSVSCC